jgi:hypothetical protein
MSASASRKWASRRVPHRSRLVVTALIGQAVALLPDAEQRAIRDALASVSVATPVVATLIAAAAPPASQKEVPTFHEWFTGRFWREWVVGRRNKHTEVKSKENIYERHLRPVFGALLLDEIGAGQVAAFRASLVEQGLSEKGINNVLAVLSKALRYALDVELITKASKVGLYKVERPEIEPWTSSSTLVSWRLRRRRGRTGMRRCAWRARPGCAAAR